MEIMHKRGLFIITKGLSETNLISIYEFAKKHISNRLYLSINRYYPFQSSLKSNIKTCYSVAHQVCPLIDVRLLLPLPNSSPQSIIDRKVSIVLCDNPNLSKGILTEHVESLVLDPNDVVYKIHDDNKINMLKSESNYYGEITLKEQSRNVIMGGTFDHLHNAHKILLSTAALLTQEKLFCGVMCDDLLRRKVLYDLIEPLDIRIENCQQFLNDIKPGIEYVVEKISDPNGPSVTDANYQCIVASRETEKGCLSINETRKSKGWPELKMDIIDMVDEIEKSHNIELLRNESQSSMTEDKISSTKARLNMLGQLIRPITKRRVDQENRYIIGLTGGIASGKSSISKKLEKLGAVIVDCDKLGHEAYLPDSNCYNELVRQFGDEIVNTETGHINRAVLGNIVFSDVTKMKELTDIVWPAIAELAQQKISQTPSGSLVVIDAAVLLDANWQKMCDEIWVSFVPREEAISRIITRNNLSSEQANKRISSQKSNREYIEHANVIICSLWSYEYTQSQIDKAYNLLRNRMNVPQSTT